MRKVIESNQESNYNYIEIQKKLITITSNRKSPWLQITVHYLKKSNNYNRLQLLDYDYPMPVSHSYISLNKI